ncbi:MAG TPA: thioredoxin family protein [Saprospiraceae bacterium]|nr:thioredoxin family protein [Saprospiraceae bacterium]
MEFIAVNNLRELKNLAGKEDVVFAMLYKNNSDASTCTRKALEDAFTDGSQKVCLAEIDVEKTRDIHGAFGIESVPAVIFFRNGDFVNVVRGCMNQHYYKALIEESMAGQKSRDKNQPKIPQVTVYSTPSCTWCTRLKDHLNRNNIRYREINVAADPAQAEEMKRRSGQLGVPQTDIDGQMIVGFDQARIDKLLGIVAIN